MNMVMNKVHTPTNALFIKLDKVLKFTLKITLTCSYILEVCHPRCVCENWKGYVVKHNSVH